MNAVTLVVIIVAFVIGYKFIGWFMDRFKLSRMASDTTGPAEDPGTPTNHGGLRSSSWRTGFAESSAGDGTRGQLYEDPETRYARVLSLPRAYTGSEITAHYQKLSAQYHPDAVHRLGPELQEVARRQTREIVEAYEYFRVKYNLR
jgi:hypothetical protein